MCDFLVGVRLVRCKNQAFCLCGSQSHLDRAAEHGGVLEVFLGELRDALAADLVLFDVNAEGQAHQNLELAPRVEAADVKGGVRLRVTQLAGPLQTLVVAQAVLVHLREHVVRAAVDDSGAHGDLVADEVSLEGADDGDASADGRLVAELNGLLPLRPVRIHLVHRVFNLHQAVRDKGFVRSNHVLAALQALDHDVLGLRLVGRGGGGR